MMKSAMLLALLFSLAAVDDPFPLTESQTVRVQAAADGTRTIDESAFYALLENAGTWDDRQSGAVVPDFAEIAANPDAWRGQRVLIEGTLELVLKPELLREGWDSVRGIVVHVPAETGESTGSRDVIVYLTDPPALRWMDESRGIARERGSRVRMVARFCKISAFQTQGEAGGGGEWKDFSVFVGRTMQMQPPAESGIGQAQVAIMIMIVAAGIGIFLWRLRSLSRSTRNYELPGTRHRHARSPYAEESDTQNAKADELPEDPAAALDTLSARRNENA